MYIRTRIKERLTYFLVLSFQIIKKSNNEYFIRYWVSPDNDDNYIDAKDRIYESEAIAEAVMQDIIKNQIIPLI